MHVHSCQWLEDSWPVGFTGCGSLGYKDAILVVWGGGRGWGKLVEQCRATDVGTLGTLGT